MNKKLWRTGCLAAALGAMAAGQEANAQTNSAASGSWDAPATWTGGVPNAEVPVAVNGGHTVTSSGSAETNSLDVGTIAGQTGNVSVTGGQLWVLDSGTLPNLPSIRLGVTAGATGNLAVSGGSVLIDGGVDTGPAIGDLLVGDNGDGNLTMTGGELSANDEIFIGFNPTSKGVATVSGGTLRTTGRSIIVGLIGDGTLNISGTGNVVANWDMLMSIEAGSKGTLNMSGGTATANFMFTNAYTGGAGSTSVINHTGGTFRANIAYVLGRNVGTTTMNHSGGRVEAINPDGIGGDFVSGDGAGNTSTYNISGTAQLFAQANVLIAAFDGSNGTINQTGGTVTAGNNLRVGIDGTGVWNLSAGTTTAKNLFLGDFDSSLGTMNISGGVLNLSGNLNVGAALASNAPADGVRLEPSEANGFQGQALDANGTLNVIGTGGDINVTGHLLANPRDKSAYRNGAGQENDSILKFTLGTAGISTIDVGGMADLDGAIIDIDDTANYFAANPSASLTLINAAGGFGNVHTLLVSEQAGNGRGFALAPADASQYSLAIQPSGGGEKLVLTKLAGGGPDADFNNDGFVNGDDLAVWKLQYGQASNGADANNDGKTDGEDFLIWQRQFGTAPAAPVAAAVPEPASVALVAIGLAGLAGLRRRK